MKTGSCCNPFNRTPRAVGSMRKWRMSSSPVLCDLDCTLEGTVATRSAIPKAPGKEFESRTTKVPGGWSLSMLMAARSRLVINFFIFSAFLPSSRDMLDLYQNFDVSRTNFTFTKATSCGESFVELTELRLEP